MLEKKRALAAIMFTDIVGYSAIIQDKKSRASEYARHVVMIRTHQR